MSISQANYRITKGLPWERLVVVKDRRTHRILVPSDAWATIKTSTNTKKSVPLYITSEGGIMLYLTPEETRELPEGELTYDVVAVISQKSALAGGNWADITVPVATGTITVSSVDLVSSLGDSTYMELTFKKGSDFRRTLSWLDSDGNLLTITNAYMQAKDSSGVTVLDLRWYTTTPNEAAIAAMTANQRGYISPTVGETLEFHISDLNSIPVGTHSFDLFVQTTAGDWAFLSGGTLVVESSISTRPT